MSRLYEHCTNDKFSRWFILAWFCVFHVVGKVHIINLKSRRGANCISVYVLFNQPTPPIAVSCYDWKGFYFDLFPPHGDVKINFMPKHISRYIYIFTEKDMLGMNGFYFYLCPSLGDVYINFMSLYSSLYQIQYSEMRGWNGSSLL